MEKSRVILKEKCSLQMDFFPGIQSYNYKFMSAWTRVGMYRGVFEPILLSNPNLIRPPSSGYLSSCNAIQSFCLSSSQLMIHQT